MRIAYLINQYPKVSHSFIRREIHALERTGVEVVRFAVRGWSDELVDPEDIAERGRTRYLLKEGLSGLLLATWIRALLAPRALVRALRATWQMSHMSERPWIYHLVYFAQACKLTIECERSRIDHVHAHFGTNPAEVAMLARLLGGPSYSFTIHGPDEFDRPQGLHLREKVAHASHVVAISSFGRSQILRWIASADWPKVRVVHCGLETNYFQLQSIHFTSPPRLVCVGRLSAQKGQLLLLDAVHRLRDRGDQIHLVLAGDGEMREEIERYIDHNGLGSHVEITGWISGERVIQELMAARAMVLGSFAEGLPVVIMEAMALGRPVISTSIAGIPELVRDRIDGWLSPAGDVEALTDAISNAIRARPEELNAMGSSAFERVKDRHSIDREAKKLTVIFEEAQKISNNKATQSHQ